MEVMPNFCRGEFVPKTRPHRRCEGLYLKSMLASPSPNLPHHTLSASRCRCDVGPVSNETPDPSASVALGEQLDIRRCAGRSNFLVVPSFGSQLSDCMSINIRKRAQSLSPP